VVSSCCSSAIYFNFKFKKIAYSPPTGPSQSSYAPYPLGMPLQPPSSSKEVFFSPPAPEQSPPASAGSNTNGNGYIPALSSPQQQLRQYSGSYQYPWYSVQIHGQTLVVEAQAHREANNQQWKQKCVQRSLDATGLSKRKVVRK